MRIARPGSIEKCAGRESMLSLTNVCLDLKLSNIIQKKQNQSLIHVYKLIKTHTVNVAISQSTFCHWESTSSPKFLNILQTKRNIQRKYRIGTYSNTNSNTEIARKTAWRCAPVNHTILRCNICLIEKFATATHEGINHINKRSEFVS